MKPNRKKTAAPTERQRKPLPLGQAMATSGLRETVCRGRGLSAYRLMTDWELIVGRELAERCRPVKLSAGTLHLRVLPQDALHVDYMRDVILQRIARASGDALGVRRCALTQGPLPPLRTRMRPVSAPDFSAANLADLPECLESIDDTGLRRALQHLAITLRASS